MSELKPCPCGKNCNISMGKERHASDYTAWWVESECGWTSPECDDKQKAIKLWNTRPKQPEPGEYVKLSDAVEAVKNELVRVGVEWVYIGNAIDILNTLLTHTLHEKLSAMDVVRQIRKMLLPPDEWMQQINPKWWHKQLDKIKSEIGGEG